MPGETRNGAVGFDGRVAVVTGAGRGMGRQFALLLARRGAAVVVNDIGVSADAERYTGLTGEWAQFGTDALVASVADTVVDEIRNLGGRAVANTADVADPTAAASIVADAQANFGRIDVVVNNAGVVPRGPVGELSPATFMETLGVHVGGAFNVTQAAWSHFTSQGYGRVVNICSSEGILAGSAGFSAYGAAKGAMLGITRSLAAEGQPHGILVNGVLPAAMTRGNASVSHGYKREETVDKQPAHVAPAVCWLAHERCPVTGHFYDVSAGSMRSVYVSAAEGFQSERPDDFSIEEIRDNWGQIERQEPAIVPYGWAELNAFRVDLYRRRVAQP